MLEGDTVVSEEILAPMAGKILQILVKVGDTVAEDDQLLKLDAMKMMALIPRSC